VVDAKKSAPAKADAESPEVERGLVDIIHFCASIAWQSCKLRIKNVTHQSKLLQLDFF